MHSEETFSIDIRLTDFSKIKNLVTGLCTLKQSNGWFSKQKATQWNSNGDAPLLEGLIKHGVDTCYSCYGVCCTIVTCHFSKSILERKVVQRLPGTWSPEMDVTL